MRPRAWIVLFSFLLFTVGSWIAQAFGAEVLPAGTPLSVRTTQPIEADYSQVGRRFSAIVEDPVEVGGHIVIPRGARATLEVVHVERSSTLKGRDRVTLKAVSVQIGGHAYPVATSPVELKGHSQGKRAVRNIGGGAGIGAAVGGLIGGGTGAAVLGTAGGATGAYLTASHRKHLSVPPETLLQFRLNAAARIAR